MGVVGQGHRVNVKVVWGVLYPIDSREVRHAGVFLEIEIISQIDIFRYMLFIKG